MALVISGLSSRLRRRGRLWRLLRVRRVRSRSRDTARYVVVVLSFEDEHDYINMK